DPAVHRQLARAEAGSELVGAVGDIHVGGEHVVIADLDRAAGIDHHVSIEIIRVANADADIRTVGVLRPQPAALRERIVVTDFDLAAPADPAASFHAIVLSLAHSEAAVDPQPQ